MAGWRRLPLYCSWALELAEGITRQTPIGVSCCAVAGRQPQTIGMSQRQNMLEGQWYIANGRRGVTGHGHSVLPSPGTYSVWESGRTGARWQSAGVEAVTESGQNARPCSGGQPSPDTCAVLRKSGAPRHCVYYR